jgi:hypothetical protein
MVAIMDRSILGLPDPLPGTPNGERRRCVRQKLHTPVYASFNGSQTGMVVDLSELLDLHEDGFAVQIGERLEINRAVSLCLDLPETRNFIHGSGQVMWSDDAGRGGIKFSGLAEDSRKILKEWLFANLLIACSNHNARTEQLASRDEEKLPEPARFDLSIVTPTATSDRSQISSSAEVVASEVREIGDDLDAIFQLITERAVNLTGASGAALAFLTDGIMICRARAGEPAPLLGAPVDMKQGLSGQCVRTGLVVSSEDAESDPRIDPAVGRAMGIGSLMAVPIASHLRVIGLLEIFSPRPQNFTKSHETILDRLVKMIPKLQPGNAEPETAISENTKSGKSNNTGSTHTGEVSLEKAAKFSEPIPQLVQEPMVAKSVAKQNSSRLFSSWFHLGLLGLAMAVIAVVVGYVVSPLIEKRWAGSTPAPQSHARNRNTQAKSLAGLRTLADQGDPEAQYQLGVRYDEGESVPKDDAQAVQWFERAADQGQVDAQAHLGAYYWAGRGVPEDLSKAYMWSMIALAGGDDNSKSRLEGLASQMTRAQVSAARQQAEEWIHTHTQQAKSDRPVPGSSIQTH